MDQTFHNHDPKRIDAVLNALAARVNTEITTYWSRNNVLLVVNVGLLAVGFNQRTCLIAAVPLGLFGVMTAVIWFIVAERGYLWLRYWENKLIQLEATLPLPHMYEPFWRLPVKDAIKQGRPKAVSKLIFPIPFLVIGAWVVLLVGSFISSISAAAQFSQ